MAYQVGFYFNNLLHVQSRHPPNKGRAICFVSWMWAVTAGNELVRLAHCQQNVHNTSTSRTWATHWQYVGYYLGVLGLTEYFREKKKNSEPGTAFSQCTSDFSFKPEATAWCKHVRYCGTLVWCHHFSMITFKVGCSSVWPVATFRQFPVSLRSSGSFDSLSV